MNNEMYAALTSGKSGQVSLTDRARFRLTGPDRVRYLNGQVTNDVTKLAPHQAFYAATLTGKGKLVSDLFIGATTDALWLDAPLALREIVQTRLGKFLIADDAELEDLTESWTLTHLFGAGPDSFPGCHALANRRFGLAGWDVWQPGPARKFDLPVVAPDVIEILRVECAWGKWGVELDDTTLPQEALLERHGLSFEKGCYVGQETVARLRSIGQVNRKLAFFEQISGPEETALGDLCVDEITAGKLTSLVFSPLLKKNIALGYVSKKFHQLPREMTSAGRIFRRTEPPRRIS